MVTKLGPLVRIRIPMVAPADQVLGIWQAGTGTTATAGGPGEEDEKVHLREEQQRRKPPDT